MRPEGNFLRKTFLLNKKKEMGIKNFRLAPFPLFLLWIAIVRGITVVIHVIVKLKRITEKVTQGFKITGPLNQFCNNYLPLKLILPKTINFHFRLPLVFLSCWLRNPNWIIIQINLKKDLPFNVTLQELRENIHEDDGEIIFHVFPITHCKMS